MIFKIKCSTNYSKKIPSFLPDAYIKLYSNLSIYFVRINHLLVFDHYLMNMFLIYMYNTISMMAFTSQFSRKRKCMLILWEEEEEILPKLSLCII